MKNTANTNVIQFPVPHTTMATTSIKRRLTKRGKAVVTVLYTVLALTIGYYVIGAMGEAMNYEYSKAHATGVQHNEIIKAKKGLQ
jgi:hypothetical protein